MHEQERFASIEDGESIDKAHQIELILQDKSILPEGYHWEEKGREFSYKGMFYDIVSIKKTNKGWVIKAATDEEEAAIVANQHKVHHSNKADKSNPTSSKVKLNLSFEVYHCNQLFDFKHSAIIQNKKGYFISTTPILNRYKGEITHPPEAV